METSNQYIFRNIVQTNNKPIINTNYTMIKKKTTQTTKIVLLLLLTCRAWHDTTSQSEPLLIVLLFLFLLKMQTNATTTDSMLFAIYKLYFISYLYICLCVLLLFVNNNRTTCWPHATRTSTASAPFVSPYWPRTRTNKSPQTQTPYSITFFALTVIIIHILITNNAYHTSLISMCIQPTKVNSNCNWAKYLAFFLHSFSRPQIRHFFRMKQLRIKSNTTNYSILPFSSCFDALNTPFLGITHLNWILS